MKNSLTFVLMIVASFAFGQTQKADQFSTWYDFSGNHKIAENYKLHTLFSFRRHDGLIADNQQELYRIVGVRKLSNQVDAGLGYDFVRTLPYGEFPVADEVNEHRLTQRLVVKQKLFKKLNLSHRYIVEERFVKDKDMALRFRGMLQASLPIAQLGENNNQLSLVANDELFIAVNNSPDLFNQNWAYFGTKYQVDKNKTVSLGYRNQYLVKASGAKVENNHTLAFGLNWNIDFTK